MPGSSGARPRARCQGYRPHSQPALGDFPETALPWPATPTARLHELDSPPVPVPSPGSSPISVLATAIMLRQAHVEVWATCGICLSISRQGHELPEGKTVSPLTARVDSQSVQPTLPEQTSSAVRSLLSIHHPPQSHPRRHHCLAVHSQPSLYSNILLSRRTSGRRAF